MIRADLSGMIQQNISLDNYVSDLMVMMQELCEIEMSIKHQGDLEDFAPELRETGENLFQQIQMMKQLTGKLEEIVNCLECSEKEIIQEYEQERVVHPRTLLTGIHMNPDCFLKLKTQVRF